MAGSKFYQGAGALTLDILSGGRLQREGDANARQAFSNMMSAQGQMDILNNTPIGKSDLPPQAAMANTATGKTKKTKGPTGPTTVQIEKSYQDMLNSITQEEIKSRQEVVTSTEEKFRFEQQSLASEITEKRASLKAAKNFTAAQYRMVDQAISDL